VCCGVLRCVAVCCGVLQCVAVWRSISRYIISINLYIYMCVLFRNLSRKRFNIQYIVHFHKCSLPLHVLAMQIHVLYSIIYICVRFSVICRINCAGFPVSQKFMDSNPFALGPKRRLSHENIYIRIQSYI